MTIAVVQTSAVATFPQGGSGNTATATLSGVAAGNALIAIPFGTGANITTATYSVNDGSAYTADVTQNLNNTNGGTLHGGIFSRRNVAPGSYSIVATDSAGSFSAFGWLVVIEVSGLDNAAAVVTNTNTATNSAPTTGSATPSTASSIAIALCVMDDLGNPASFGHPPSGYTSITAQLNGSVTSSVGSTDYLILSAATVQNPSYATFTDANLWNGMIAIYEAAVVAGFPVGNIIT